MNSERITTDLNDFFFLFFCAEDVVLVVVVRLGLDLYVYGLLLGALFCCFVVELAVDIFDVHEVAGFSF